LKINSMQSQTVNDHATTSVTDIPRVTHAEP
jgi:hypothetical protein